MLTFTAIMLGIFGALVAIVGALAILMAFMPNFGGSDERWAFPFGLALFGIGLVAIFYAGSILP